MQLICEVILNVYFGDICIHNFHFVGISQDILYCRKFMALSNQMSRYISKSIRMYLYCRKLAIVVGMASLGLNLNSIIFQVYAELQVHFLVPIVNNFTLF